MCGDSVRRLGRKIVGRWRRRVVGSWFGAAQLGEMREAVEIAAHAKTTIAGEIALVVEHRQARQLDRQAAAVVDRPVDGDAVPGVARRNRFSDAAGRVESEGFGNLVPRPADAGGRARADQAGELIRAEEEAVL